MPKTNKHLLFLFLWLAVSTPCFAGGIKGPLIDEETVVLFVCIIVAIHLFSVIAYYQRITWLRVICGVLYLPIFLTPLILSLLHPAFTLLFIPTIGFYVLIIARKRK